MGAAQELRQEAFTLLDRSEPQIVAVQLDQVEGAEHGGVVMLPVAQQLEHREAALIDHDGLAVDEAGAHRQASDGLDDLREAVGEIVAIPRVQPNATAVAPRHDAEAVVLDLVQPALAARRLLGWTG